MNWEHVVCVVIGARKEKFTACSVCYFWIIIGGTWGRSDSIFICQTKNTLYFVDKKFTQDTANFHPQAMLNKVNELETFSLCLLNRHYDYQSLFYLLHLRFLMEFDVFTFIGMNSF